MAQITIDQLVDIVQADLTVSGLFPQILPNNEILRIVKEHALEWFYKNYQFATIKSYYYMKKECFTHELYTSFKYFVLPDEIESLTRIIKISDPSLFRLGIQAPHLSINLGVTNQPFLTSFVTTAGDLALYRSVISYFSDEINKLTKETVKFNFNPINKQLNFLGLLESYPGETNHMLECGIRIQEEELFDFEMFKRYCIGLCRIRMGEQIGRFNFNMPGNFNYNAADIITGGQAMVDKVNEEIKGQTVVSWFRMAK